jgi:heme/copper-type cytochrome/quinol oxidase subunit 2
MEEVKNYESLTYDELTQISRDDHQEDVRQYDKQQNALCLVVIGAIVLICGLLFFFLSVVRKKNGSTSIDPTVLPFYVSMACFGASAILLVIGLVRFFKAHVKRKELKVEINEVTKLKSKMISQND